MRVMQLADSFGDAGGMERFIYDLSQRLASRADETVVVTPQPASQGKWGERKVPHVCPGDALQQYVEFADSFDPHLVVWHAGDQTAAAAARIADRHRVVSVIHNVVCPSGSRLFRDKDEICRKASGVGCLALWYGRRCGTSKSPRSAIAHLARHRAVMDTLMMCERIYAVSQSVQSFLSIEGVTLERIRVIDSAHGALANAPALARSAHAPAQSVRLLYVGRLVYAKGVQYLLRAILHLLADNISVECDIVGDGWYRDTLQKLVASLGLSTVVRFVGSVPGQSVGAWYEASDIVVIPSIWPEPSALVVPEARSHGKPVVVTDAGGLPEWANVTDGITVAQPANASSLAAAITRAMGWSETEIELDSQTPIQRQGSGGRIDLLGDLTLLMHESSAVTQTPWR